MNSIEKIDSVSKIIEVQFFGNFQKETLLPIVRKTRIKALKSDHKIIFDFRESHIQFSVADAYYWIPNYYDVIDPLIKIVPVANIPGEKNFDLFSFLETAFINKGAQIRLCSNERDSIDWLNQNKSNNFEMLGIRQTEVFLEN